MKKTLIFILILIPNISFCQEWMLGKTKEYILNEYKNIYSIKSIDSNSIEFKYKLNDYSHSFSHNFFFKNNRCISILWDCTYDVKNALVARYVKAEYNTVVKKEKNADTGASLVYIIFNNHLYNIEVMDSEMGDSENALYLVITSYAE